MGRGSMRRRGKDSWELRVYLGTDPETGRQRWLTKTVHGTKRFARTQLRELAGRPGTHGFGPARSVTSWIGGSRPPRQDGLAPRSVTHGP